MSAHLTPELLRSLLDYDHETGRLFWKERAGRKAWNKMHAGKDAFASVHSSGYRRGTLLGRTYDAHRLIYAMVFGFFPPQVDHINGVRHDNRLCNLRGVTKAENAKNTASPRNTSGCCGVAFNARLNKWQAYINREQRRVHLGVYRTLNEAMFARKSAESEAGYGPSHGRLTDYSTPAHGEGYSNASA